MNAASTPCPTFTPGALGYPLLLVQKVLGWLGMILLLSALVSLVDGLTAEMQRGPDRLDVLAGTESLLSGPIPVKKAELSDFTVQGNSADGQVRLVLDDFFASHWFGSGMWRGRLVVGDNPGIGEYHMVVEFRDAPPKGAQKYRVVVWADEASMREGSYSWVTRQFGYSPFMAAGYLLPLGLLVCVVNFLFGRQRANMLQAVGCGEMFKVMRGEGNSEKAKAIGAGRVEASFALGEQHGVTLGQRCLVMRPDATPVMEALVAFCDVRHSSFLLDSSDDVRAGDVVFPLQAGMVTAVSETSSGADAGGKVPQPAAILPQGVPLAPFRPATARDRQPEGAAGAEAADADKPSGNQ